MKCITTVLYLVIINGVVHGRIFPTRGLRQGDPLSPYLFLLCVDGFSSLIKDAARNQSLSGISFCKGCPMVTHLFFAVDNLLFCRANDQECHKPIEILELYEAASGQKVNVENSSVFFSHNTPHEKKCAMLNILGPMQDTRHGKYLGLPPIIGRSKIEVFAELKEKVGRKLAGWKGKLLSIGGREILIKAMAQAVPTYTMSCFLILKGLYEEIEGMIRKFWWGQRQDESKIPWVSWEKMCRAKSNGGMGFRNLQAFNLAMLMKQGWSLLSNPNSLCAKVFKARYYPNGNVLNSKLGCSPSYT